MTRRPRPSLSSNAAVLAEISELMPLCGDQGGLQQSWRVISGGLRRIQGVGEEKIIVSKATQTDRDKFSVP